MPNYLGPMSKKYFISNRNIKAEVVPVSLKMKQIYE